MYFWFLEEIDRCHGCTGFCSGTHRFLIKINTLKNCDTFQQKKSGKLWKSLEKKDEVNVIFQILNLHFPNVWKLFRKHLHAVVHCKLLEPAVSGEEQGFRNFHM